MMSKSKVTYITFICTVFTGCLCLGAFVLCGCSTVKEGLRCVLGVSTKVLEDGRKNAVSKSFNYDYATTYKKTKDGLQVMNAYIYKEDASQHLIAVYLSSTDTTPVGIFFKTIDASTTQVEVSSPSTFAKETLSKRLFMKIEGIKEEKEEAKEGVGPVNQTQY
jgi:hypothetical protein